MKLFVYSMREFDEKPFFDQFCKKYNITYDYTTETPCPENLYLAKGYDTIDIITTKFTPQMLDLLAEYKVRCIATRTIGYDHIDMDYAKKLGIRVCNVTYSPASVADYTLMMILMGLRKIKRIEQSSQVQDFTLQGKIARELPDCTVGVIGTGRIGETVIKYLTGFGCPVLAYDPYPKDSVRPYAEYVSLDTLLEKSDIITLHAPLTDDNHHMLGTSAFAQMKPGVDIVNCARGPLIDSDALIEAIESEKVGFACLDVVEHEHGLYYFNRAGEPLNNPRLAILRSYSNVIVTPHMAFYTDNAVSDMAHNSIKEAMKCLGEGNF